MGVFAIVVGIPVLIAGILLFSLVIAINRHRDRACRAQERNYFKRLDGK